MAFSEPPSDCPLCPRLAEFRREWRQREPSWYNAPVPSFGPIGARLLLVGLAPGLRGANRTGRPFTGDYAGVLLYETLLRSGFARGDYREEPDDGFVLTDCRIVNSVRCVPPLNKPTGAEIATCRTYLIAALEEMPNIKAILALGRIAHETTVLALGQKPARVAFGHGKRHMIGGIELFNSYHCSRYNTSTGRLTPQMFQAVVRAIREKLDAS